MTKSKCKWCRSLVAFDPATGKVTREFFCDTNSYDPNVGCNRRCHGYGREKEDIKTASRNIAEEGVNNG